MQKKPSSQYDLDLQTALHTRVSSICLIAAVLFPLFSLLDLLVVPDHVTRFFVLRCGVSLLFCTIFLLNHYDTKHRYPLLLCTIGYLAAGMAITWMVVDLGGASSPYFAGLILVVITYTTILPLTLKQAFFSGLALLAMYILAVTTLAPFTSEHLPALYSHSFFLAGFVLIVSVQSHAETTARIHEYRLRMEEQDAAEALAKQAKRLEEAVELRSREHQRTEARYRILFENMADDIMLLGSTGRIITGNSSMYNHLGIKKEDDRSYNFFDFIAQQDAAAIRNELMQPLLHGETITGYSLTLYSHKGKKRMDVEISGRPFQHGGNLKGVQLVIRDITQQKRLERKLVDSTQKIKTTQSATILALAKLSEYRGSHRPLHLERIREFCLVLAQELLEQHQNLSGSHRDFLENIYQSAVLFDIGMVSVSDSLRRQDNEENRHHTIVGGSLLKSIEEDIAGESFLSMAKEMAYFHHEWWDGNGYPFGLHGEEIPLSARIVAVADAYESMSAGMIKEHKTSHANIVKVIAQSAGKQFDPQIVDAFMACQEQFLAIKKTFPADAETAQGQLVNIA